jgi:hypothetical protein
MKNTLKAISVMLVAMLAIGMFLAIPVAYAVPANMSVLNPDYTHDLVHVSPSYWTAARTYDTKHDATPAGLGDVIFHADTHADDIFYVRVNVQNVTNLWNWQIKLLFDTTLLNCTNAFVAPGTIFDFAIDSPVIIDNIAGSVMFGSGGLTEPPVSGTDDLGWIVFSIKKGVSYGEYFSCDLVLDDVDSYLNDGDMVEIPFTIQNGRYEIFWVPPTDHPYFEVDPSVYYADSLGEDVAIDIYVWNVDPAWEIIALQFALRFNASLLDPMSVEAGTFMEAFANDGESVIYAEGHDYMGDAALPDGFNAWTVGVIILPDGMGNWHAPYPADGGLVCRLHFNAILATISPTEAWTDLSFTYLENNPLNPGDDFYPLALNGLMDEISISLTDCNGGNYRAPMTVLGLAIDLYCQWPSPYGGQGFNMTADAFQPQEQVELFALVTYNEGPVQQKLVGFEVRHGEFEFTRMAFTNDVGIAHVSYRIPWPCDDPAGRVLGEWIARATVEVAKQVANDTMPFKVWWTVEITSIEPKETYYYKRKPLTSDPFTFVMNFRTYRMQQVPVVLTAVVYDELGFMIGYDTKVISAFGWGEYGHYCHFYEDTWEFEIAMPSHAMVGKCTVYANAFDKLPWFYGTPYCPEVTNANSFYVKLP